MQPGRKGQGHHRAHHHGPPRSGGGGRCRVFRQEASGLPFNQGRERRVEHGHVRFSVSYSTWAVLIVIPRARSSGAASISS